MDNLVIFVICVFLVVDGVVGLWFDGYDDNGDRCLSVFWWLEVFLLDGFFLGIEVGVLNRII